MGYHWCIMMFPIPWHSHTLSAVVPTSRTCGVASNSWLRLMGVMFPGALNWWYSDHTVSHCIDFKIINFQNILFGLRELNASSLLEILAVFKLSYCRYPEATQDLGACQVPNHTRCTINHCQSLLEGFSIKVGNLGMLPLPREVLLGSLVRHVHLPTGSWGHEYLRKHHVWEVEHPKLPVMWCFSLK